MSRFPVFTRREGVPEFEGDNHWVASVKQAYNLGVSKPYLNIRVPVHFLSWPPHPQWMAIESQCKCGDQSRHTGLPGLI